MVKNYVECDNCKRECNGNILWEVKHINPLPIPDYPNSTYYTEYRVAIIAKQHLTVEAKHFCSNGCVIRHLSTQINHDSDKEKKGTTDNAN